MPVPKRDDVHHDARDMNGDGRVVDAVIGHDFDPRKWVRIAADLRGQITSGALPPGGRLPTFAVLAAQHGVGAGTVTKAVHALAGEGLVWNVQGMGWYVRDWAAGT